jgi:aspartate aminotransferase
VVRSTVESTSGELTKQCALNACRDAGYGRMHTTQAKPRGVAPFVAAPMLRPPSQRTLQRNLTLSARAEALQPSLTLAIAAKAKALKAEGHDICSLSAGEPDFDTPTFICDAAAEALRSGQTRYGPAAGEPALREAIATKLSLENQVPTRSEQVLVTNGGKQALYNLFQVLLGPGDELLLPAPYWLSYPEIARLAGASVRMLPSSAAEGFRLDPHQLEAAISPASKLLVLNSPSNPRHTHHSLAAVAPDLADRVFSVNGFAKGWAMTGWRIGWLAGNAEVVKAAIALQSQSTSNVCSFAQFGALAAISGPRDCVQAMAERFNERRQLLSDGLQAIAGLQLLPPQGAFYAFPDVSSTGLDSMSFCNRLLDEQGLAVVPGMAFGDDRCVRLSCAAANSSIEDGLHRLERFIQSL